MRNKIKKPEINISSFLSEDNILHEKEIGFAMLCEKYIDECAMRFAAVMLEQYYLGNYKTRIDPARPVADIAEVAYDAAEQMLKQKLKRNEIK